MATSDEKLISALRRAKSRSALYEVPSSYFSEEGLKGFEWLRAFVEAHQEWPTAGVFRQNTGLDTIATKNPLSYYIDDCRKKALWQMQLDPFKLMRTAMETKNPDGFVDLCRQVITASTTLNSQRTGLITLADSMQLVSDDYDIAKSLVGLRGIPTSFPFLDEATDGFQNANLYSIVARTGVGKTYMLLAMALAAHRAGYSVLFLTMEMGVVQVARRAFGMLSGYNPKFLRQGKLSSRIEQEMKSQIEAYQDQPGAPFYWMAGKFKKTIDALRIAAYETQPDIIFADASYLLKPSDRTRHNARHELLNDVMEGLADITTDLNRPLVQSIQFNRQAIKGKKEGDSEETRRNPIAHLALEKIGGTDTVGQISAFVAGLSEGDGIHARDERYCGILKGREGESGWFKYKYQFQPVDFSQIMDHTQVLHAPANTDEAPSMAFMDTEV